MSELQKYSIDRNQLERGRTGKISVCLSTEVDARLALMQRDFEFVHKLWKEARVEADDRADRMEQLEERLALMQRAVNWLLENGAGFNSLGELVDPNSEVIQVPAEFAAIITPRRHE